MIVAIDGPAGAGKSTVAKLLARKLGFSFLDTGAMYRAITVLALRSKIAFDDTENIARLARQCSINFDAQGRVFLNNEDVSEAIRQPVVNKSISPIAANAGVREYLVSLQQKIGSCGDYVLEGRDTATVVFPGAEFKFYLDAQVSERALRRYKELTAKGLTVFLSEIEEEVKKRDFADSSRSVGALKVADGSRYVDTTGLSIEDVVENLYRIITGKS